MFKEKNPYQTEDEKDDIKNYREFLSSVLSIEDEKIKKEEFSGYLLKDVELTKKLLKESIIIELRDKEAYKKLADYRNIINHGKGTDTFDSIKKAIEISFPKCMHILEKYPLVNAK